MGQVGGRMGGKVTRRQLMAATRKGIRWSGQTACVLKELRFVGRSKESKGEPHSGRINSEQRIHYFAYKSRSIWGIGEKALGQARFS